MNPYYEDLYNQYIAQRGMPPGMPTPMEPMEPGLPVQPVVPPVPTPMPGPRPPRPRPPMPGPRPPMPGPRPPRPPMPGPRPPRPRPPMPPPRPRPPRPRPIPIPVPVPVPRPLRPLNVYLCRYYSATEDVNFCQYTVAFGDQPFPLSPECSTFVAGPFYSMHDADAFIESFGVRRGQTFMC